MALRKDVLSFLVGLKGRLNVALGKAQGFGNQLKVSAEGAASNRGILPY